eukprot:GEMP01074431.1.p1 GENE.GEMP01074431.1~~GEMP01074431.1.p1  ORF type:complete len:148 (+),score=18.04 GEMP01074431.1:55-444(+)
MAIQSIKKKKQNSKGKASVIANKRRTKDHDQKHDDLKNKHKFEKMPINEDLPGEGQHYCISCARYFMDAQSLQAHFKSKLHKRRLKAVLEDPWTQQDAEKAAGMSIEKYTTQNKPVPAASVTSSAMDIS